MPAPSRIDLQAPRRRYVSRRYLVWALSLLSSELFLAPPSWSQQQSRPKLGVALQGGGAKGFAHIGVLRWFEDHHIPVDYIAGTSMGGLMGGLYAAGYSPSEIEKIVTTNIDWNVVLSGEAPYRDLAFRRKEDLRALPNGLELGLRNGLQPPGGLNSGQPVRMIIDRYVLPYSDNRSFDTLPVPFRCVATDLVSGKPVIFHDGSLANALRATMSIPGVFAPVKHDGEIYADGGLLDNLPTDVAKQMGADVVIGVHLTTGPVAPQNITSLFQVAGASMDVMINANELRGMELADLLITVSLPGYGTLDFSQIQQIISKGYAAAESRANLLNKFRLSDEEWKQYQAERESRRVKTVAVPQFVVVEGASQNIAQDLQKSLSGFAGKPIDTAKLEDKLTTIVGVGRLTSLSYGLTQRNDQQGLLITAEEKDYSPPWFKPGFVVDGSDPNNVQFDLGSRLTFLDIGGYRSEVRLDFSVGSIYSFAGEYYHPFTPASRWFTALTLGASKSPLNLYMKDTLLAEYKLDQVSGGADLGFAFDRFDEIRLGYQAGYLNVGRWVGSPLLPNVSGRTGEIRARYAMDRLDNPIIPRRGTALLLNGNWITANPGNHGGFPAAELTFLGFQPVSRAASVYVVAEAGSTFGHEYVGLPQFALGSPSRLAAYGVDEFLTNQYVYGRLGYLHRVAALPAFLGSGIYLDAHYELAKPYGLRNFSGLASDGVVGVVTQTLIGPVLLGASVGEEDHHKWFFQVGRVF